jgi:putative DNA primase/helicase
VAAYLNIFRTKEIIMRTLAKLPPIIDHTSGFALIPLSTLPQQEISWCWPNRIPRGMVTVLAGYQKSGKSMVACSIAATITCGGKFPGSKREAKRGHVVMINNEDHPQQVLRPRIAAAGGDLSRLHIMQGQANLSAANLIEKLEPKLDKIPYLRALILDPITSAVSLNRNSGDHVRGVLAGLGALAARRNIAVIVVVHLNKSAGPRAISQVSGSFEWTAASRAGFLVVEEVGTSRHLFLPMANNIGLAPDGLAFRIKTKEVDGIRAPRVVWEKEPIEMSADDALAVRSGDADKVAAAREIDELLRKLLASGKRRSTEVFVDGKEHGFSRKQLHTAADRLGVRKFNTGGPETKKWWWQLGGAANSSAASEDKADDVADDDEAGDVTVGYTEW